MVGGDSLTCKLVVEPAMFEYLVFQLKDMCPQSVSVRYQRARLLKAEPDVLIQIVPLLPVPKKRLEGRD